MAARKNGRPSQYDPRFVEEASKLCLLGATDIEIADFFNVTVRTIYRWQQEHEDFCHALKVAKTEADERVERSLYSRATGYSYEAVKIFMPANASKPVYAPYREHVPPDTTSMIFWLKNRQRDKWRDKQDYEHSGPNGGPIETVTEIRPQLSRAEWEKRHVLKK